MVFFLVSFSPNHFHHYRVFRARLSQTTTIPKSLREGLAQICTACQKTFGFYIRNEFEKISLLLKDNVGIPPIYLTKWWFGCFLDRVPFPLALRVWDVFLYHGDSILMAMSLNI